MDSLSSTSSSEGRPGDEPDFLAPGETLASSTREDRGGRFARLPWAGLLAAALVLVADALVFSPDGPWEWMLGRLQDSSPLERGLIHDRLALRAARDDTSGRPRVTFVGTSRTDASFMPELIPEALHPPIQFLEQTHAQMFPPELLSMLDEILDQEPDLVVTVLSELEFCRPLKLVPQAFGRDLSAAWELARLGGPAFVLEQRMAFLRMACLGLLDAYRYRGVLGKVLFNEWRRFPRGARMAGPQAAVAWPDVLSDGAPAELPAGREAEVLARLQAFYTGKEDIVAVQVEEMRSIRPGRHAAIKLAMMESSIVRLRAAGIGLLILEGVTHPDTYALYDAEGTRAMFLDWATRMEREHGVRFVPRDAVGYGPHAPIDFRDLTHLGKEGARRSTAFLMWTCAQILVPDWTPPAPPSGG